MLNDSRSLAGKRLQEIFHSVSFQRQEKNWQKITASLLLHVFPD